MPCAPLQVLCKSSLLAGAAQPSYRNCGQGALPGGVCCCHSCCLGCRPPPQEHLQGLAETCYPIHPPLTVQSPFLQVLPTGPANPAMHPVFLDHLPGTTLLSLLLQTPPQARLWAETRAHEGAIGFVMLFLKNVSCSKQLYCLVDLVAALWTATGPRVCLHSWGRVLEATPKALPAAQRKGEGGWRQTWISRPPDPSAGTHPLWQSHITPLVWEGWNQHTLLSPSQPTHTGGRVPCPWPGEMRCGITVWGFVFFLIHTETFLCPTLLYQAALWYVKCKDE